MELTPWQRKLLRQAAEEGKAHPYGGGQFRMACLLEEMGLLEEEWTLQPTGRYFLTKAGERELAACQPAPAPSPEVRG